MLVINGQRLKLTWGRPKFSKSDQKSWDQQGSVAQQQYYMQHPRPSNQDMPYYPSMDPQRMGAAISTQELGSSSTS